MLANHRGLSKAEATFFFIESYVVYQTSTVCFIYLFFFLDCSQKEKKEKRKHVWLLRFHTGIVISSVPSQPLTFLFVQFPPGSDRPPASNHVKIRWFGIPTLFLQVNVMRLYVSVCVRERRGLLIHLLGNDSSLSLSEIWKYENWNCIRKWI